METQEATTTIPCSYCGGEIKAAARRCRHCKRDVGRAPEPTAALTASLHVNAANYACPHCAAPTALGAMKCGQCWKIIDPPAGPEVLRALRAFLTSRGLLRVDQVDPLLAKYPEADAAVVLGYLGAHGLLTPVQVESAREGFRQTQLATASRGLQLVAARGLLEQTHVQQALDGYQSAVFQQTIYEYAITHRLLTAMQIAEIHHAAAPSSGVPGSGLRANWAKVPQPFRIFALCVLGVMLFGSLAGIIGAIRGTPDIRESCTMNGLGEGKCAFTNRGTRAGSVCGHIAILCAGRERRGSTFCSGVVGEHETRNVSFEVTGLEDIRSFRTSDWRRECNFDFFRDGTGN